METKKIGVAISTRNRRSVFNKTYAEWKRYLPSGAKLVVVDDASDDPCPVATTRFESQQGIAKTKNECIRLLLERGCTHLLLSDDDTWPLNGEAINRYALSGLHHACLSRQPTSGIHCLRTDVYVTDKKKRYWEYNWPNGCMVFLTAEAAIRVSGYDESFGIWSCEHSDLSIRVYLEGLTPAPFIDIPEGSKHFWCLDFSGEVDSSVPEKDRRKWAAKNHELLFEKHKGLI